MNNSSKVVAFATKASAVVQVPTLSKQLKDTTAAH